MISFIDSITTCLSEKYFTLSGRASRAEYWWFALASWLLMCLPSDPDENEYGAPYSDPEV